MHLTQQIQNFNFVCPCLQRAGRYLQAANIEQNDKVMWMRTIWYTVRNKLEKEFGVWTYGNKFCLHCRQHGQIMSIYIVDDIYRKDLAVTVETIRNQQHHSCATNIVESRR